MRKSSIRWRSWLQLLLGLAITLLFFYMMAPFLLPILLGAVIAIICYPTVEWLKKKKVPRILAALISTLGVVALILMPLIFLLYSGAYRLVKMLGHSTMFQQGNVDELLYHPVVSRVMNFIYQFMPADREWIRDQAISLAQNIAETLSKLFAGFIAGMPAVLVASSVLVLSAYFFLLDGSRFLRFLSALSPLGKERSRELYTAFEQSCRGVVLGLFASSATQAVIMVVFFRITGLPEPGFAGIATFIAGMIPVVGSAPIWIGATLYLFLKHKAMWGFVMLIGGLMVSTSDNVVRPLVMRGRAEMHPLLALVSVFGAVNLFGASGIFVGPVIAAVFVSFLRILSIEINVKEEKARS